MEATDPRAWIGRTVGGRYPIVAPLGRGGAGQVFLARQQPLGREVAVKLLRPELLGSSRDEYQARFLREAALAGRIAHPNVVTVHDYGVEDDGTSYVVMELLHGDLLADLVQGGLALEPHRAARIVRDIAKGLRAAHDLGLVHRDVKPHNVVVVEEDGGERPVLIDFGLVKVHDGEDHDSAYETRKGTYMGTPAYMAPEQARGDGVDPRADLYALGVMLYRLLTGAVPFWADNPLGLAVQHLTEPVPPMEVRAPGCNVPPGLEAIARRLLEKDPARRYADATEVVVALDAWLAGPLPLPEPRGSGTPLAALGAGIGAFGLLLAAGGLVVGFGLLGLALRSRPGEVVALPPVEARPLETPAVPEVPAVPVAPAPAVAPAAPPVAPAVPVAPPVPVPPRPVAPRPLPMPVPVGAPLPLPMPGDAATRAVMVDGVPLTPEAAGRALAFVNGASAEELRRAGVYDKGVEIILAQRPFVSLEAFGATYGIGRKTVEAVAGAR